MTATREIDIKLSMAVKAKNPHETLRLLREGANANSLIVFLRYKVPLLFYAANTVL